MINIELASEEWVIDQLSGLTNKVLKYLPIGVYNIELSDDIIIAPNTDNNLILPNTPIDKKPYLVKNLSSSDITLTSNVYQIDGSVLVYTIPSKSALTIAYFTSGTNWVIESDYLIPQITSDSQTIKNLNGHMFNSYSVLETDDVILSYGDTVSVSLMDNLPNGKEITIKNLGITNTTINPLGIGVGIDGIVAPYILEHYQCITLLFDGTDRQWYIISKYSLLASLDKVVKYMTGGDYNVLETDDIILIGNGTPNIYLPVSGNTNKQYLIKNLIDTQTVISIIDGSKFDDNMGGLLSYKLNRHEALSFIYNSTTLNWSVSSNYISTDPGIRVFTNDGLYDTFYFDDIIISNGTSVNFNLPVLSTIKDGKQLIFKNIGSASTTIFPLNGESPIEDFGNGVPYALAPDSSVTFIIDKTTNKWLIIGESTPKSVIQTTYHELEFTNGSYIPGHKYLITDYQTVHTITGTSDINEGVIEPLIITAMNSTTFYPEAYSPLYPKDVIYYNFSNNQSVVPGCTKGYIYRRVDTIKNNDLPMDFRNVKFRRWQIDVTNVWSSGTTYNLNSAVLATAGSTNIYISLFENTNHPVTDTNYWKLFEWSNLSYPSTQPTTFFLIGSSFPISIPCTVNYNDYYIYMTSGNYGNSWYNNKINSNNIAYNIIESCNNVIYGSSFYNNIIGDYFTYNSIGSSFRNNIIGSEFHANSIGTNFEGNIIKYDFSSNSIGDNFGHNEIDFGFSSNNISDRFSYNYINGLFGYNTFGYNVTNNTFKTFFTYNKVKGGFTNNSYHCGSTFDIDFMNATHVYQDYTTETFTNSSLVNKLRYYDGTNALVVVNANA